MRDIQKHHYYYFSQALIMICGVILAMHFRYDIRLTSLVITVMAILYVAWGILHHHFEHNLTLKIVIEYILMAVIGLVVLSFLIKGAF